MKKTFELKKIAAIVTTRPIQCILLHGLFNCLNYNKFLKKVWGKNNGELTIGTFYEQLLAKSGISQSIFQARSRGYKRSLQLNRLEVYVE